MDQNNQIILGGGCFWKFEILMQRLHQVEHVEVAYSGGNLDYPCYRLICTGATNHAEVFKVTYKAGALEEILQIFFENHDPTQLNRQGFDIGTQYRSCIYYYSEDQLEIINKVIKTLEDGVVTEVAPFKNYWKAEGMHQKYLEKAGQSAEKGSEDIILCYN